MNPEAIEEIPLAEILFSPAWFIGWSILVFLYGCIIGSFLNVAIYRMPLGLSVNNPKRSFCFRCGTQIRAIDNFPVLGYLMLRGRDHACGARFSPRYMGVEFLTGSIFLLLWLAHNQPGVGGFSPITLWYFVFAALLIIGTFTDFDHWIVPAIIPRIGLAGALVAALLAGFFDQGSLIAQGGPFPQMRLYDGDLLDRALEMIVLAGTTGGVPREVLWWEPFANALLGGILAPLAVWGVGFLGKIIFRKDAMGFGDVELFAMIGATAGPIYAVLILVIASFYGSAAGIIGIIRAKRRQDNSPLALGELHRNDAEALAASASSGSSVAVPALEEDEEQESARDFAASMEMDFVDLCSVPAPTDELRSLFQAEELERLEVVPLAHGNGSLRLATRDPLRTSLVVELRKRDLGEVEFVIATPAQIEAYRALLASPAAEPSAQAEPLWLRYHAVASVLPLPKSSSHLPFIPWIALGCLTVIAFHDWLTRFMATLFVPQF